MTGIAAWFHVTRVAGLASGVTQATVGLPGWLPVKADSSRNPALAFLLLLSDRLSRLSTGEAQAIPLSGPPQCLRNGVFIQSRWIFPCYRSQPLLSKSSQLPTWPLLPNLFSDLGAILSSCLIFMADLPSLPGLACINPGPPSLKFPKDSLSDAPLVASSAYSTKLGAKQMKGGKCPIGGPFCRILVFPSTEHLPSTVLSDVHAMSQLILIRTFFFNFFF